MSQSIVPLTMEEVNRLEPSAFVTHIGPVFEHSPWIAARVLDRRPFSGRDHLFSALQEVVGEAAEADRLDLLRAHPDLGGRLASRGLLTADSLREQAAAGLAALTPGEADELAELNAAYAGKFGFPFIICARLSGRHAILRALRERIGNGRAEEMAAALREVGKIAALRLAERLDEKRKE